MSIAAALLLSLQLAASEPAEPRVFALTATHTIVDVVTEDLDGDGLRDILALVRDEDQKEQNVKVMDAFLAGEAGSFPEQPSLRTQLRPETGALLFAEYDGTPPRELLDLTHEEVRVLAYQGTEGDAPFSVVETLPVQSLVPTGSRRPCFLPDAAHDLDDDGIDEWFLPSLSGYRIVQHAPGGQEPRSRHIAADTASVIGHASRLRIVHTAPEIHFFGEEEDGTRGVAFLSDSFADFAYGPNLEQTARFAIPEPESPKAQSETKMEDINADGLMDLIITETEGTVDVKVRIDVYLASAPGVYPQEPSATVTDDGSFAEPIIEDVNGDGNGDLAIIKIPFGLGFFVNYFVRSLVVVHIDVFLFRDGTYAEEPDFTSKLSIDAPEDDAEVAYAIGDYNGDGRIDAALSSGDDALAVHIGEKGEFLARRPWLEIDLPPVGTARTVNIDDNGRDDILLMPPQTNETQTFYAIIF